MNTYPEEIHLLFTSYANIPFRADIWAEEINIEWGDETLSVYHHSDLMTVNHEYSSEGLKEIHLTGKNIQYLNVSHLSLTSLSLSQCRQLKYLDCSVNELQKLDLTACIQLEELYAHSNNLIDLQLGALSHLSQLQLSYNNLGELNITGCTALQHLYCSFNHLNNLILHPNLPLNQLDISHNLLNEEELNQIFLNLSPSIDIHSIHYLQNSGSEFCNPHLLKTREKS